jgi:polyisoprenoid-binding protein YceI
LGTFEITQTKTDSVGQKVIGNLTLKGKTNAIEIPVRLHIDEKTITVESQEFAIDRTRWGIVYSSGVIGTLKDDLINDEVLIKIKLVAARKP